MLDQHGGEQGVVGQCNRCRGRRTQPRSQVGQRDHPGCRRHAPDDQQAGAGIGAAIVQVQQGTLRRALGVIDGDPGAGGVRGRVLIAQFVAGDQYRAAAAPPQLGEMALAAVRRAMQHEGVPRPVGPALDPAESRRVAVGNEKIGTAERRPMRQVERQLGRPGHRTRVSVVTVSAGSLAGSGSPTRAS
jgi:hypothetical protein